MKGDESKKLLMLLSRMIKKGKEEFKSISYVLSIMVNFSFADILRRKIL